MASTAVATSISTDEPEPPPLLHADEIVRPVRAAARRLSADQATAALGRGVERARVQVQHARVATERGRKEHRGKGAPHLARPAPREAELAELTKPPGAPRGKVPAEQSKLLRALDGSVATIRDQLLRNPLWIAASHLERAQPSAKVDELLASDPELARARTELGRAESAMTRANRALEAWNAKPAWLRAVQNFVLGSGEKVHADFDKAAGDLIAKHHTAQRTETEARYSYEERASDLNASAREKQDDARRVREALEAPLRAVLIERGMAQDIVTRSLDLRPLRDAPTQDRLEFAGIHAERGIAYHEFRSASAVYRMDSLELSASTNATALTPGDTFTYGVTPEGARALAFVERGPHIGLDQPVIEGVVGAAHRDGEKLLKFELTDEHGTTRWVVPTRGDDIHSELAGDLASTLTAGNLVVIQNREASVVERAHAVDIDI